MRALMRHLDTYPTREPGIKAIKAYKWDLPTTIAERRRSTGLSRTYQASRFVFISSTAAHANAESYSLKCSPGDNPRKEAYPFYNFNLVRRLKL